MRRSEVVSVADLEVGANKHEIFATIFGDHYFLTEGAICLPLAYSFHYISVVRKMEFISSFPNSNIIFVLKMFFYFCHLCVT